MQKSFFNVKETHQIIKNNWARLWLGAMLFLLPLVLALLVPYVGLAISIMLFAWLGAGYLQYVYNIIKGIETNVYQTFKFYSGPITVFKLIVSLILAVLATVFSYSGHEIMFYLTLIALMLVSVIAFIEVVNFNKPFKDKFLAFGNKIKNNMLEFTICKINVMLVYILFVLVLIYLYSLIYSLAISAILLAASLLIVLSITSFFVFSYMIMYTYTYSLVKYENLKPAEQAFANDTSQNVLANTDANKMSLSNDIANKSMPNNNPDIKKSANNIGSKIAEKKDIDNK